MTAPIATVDSTEAQRWQAWQTRGAEGDRRRSVAMKWVMAIIAILLGSLFGGLL